MVFVAPLSGLLLLLARDRRRRIEMAHGRLELVRHERTRLQSAVRRLGEAFAAKLDLESILAIALRASVEALDADAGRLAFDGAGRRLELTEPDAVTDLVPVAGPHGQDHVGEHWSMTLPLDPADEDLDGRGTITIARRGRRFQADEVALFTELVERVRTAAGDVLAHQRLQEQAMTDQLTGLGNRRRLKQDLEACFDGRRDALLALFDLNGFKHFNDRHGHLAGDRLLERLGAALAAAASPSGTAYRLGGDEFCVLLPYGAAGAATELGGAVAALTESGDGYTITTAYGVVLLPHEAADPETALQVADERMYAQKRGRDATGQRHAADALMDALASRAPGLRDHAAEVGALAVDTGRRLGLDDHTLGELELAAELHDIGKVAVSDAILEKPGPLDALEWEIVRRHTVLGQELLEATEALRPLAPIVRASHERWDGGGYPDRLSGDAIPLGARIIAVCDAYDAMTSDRSYRRRLPGELALEELAATAGTQFDPDVVEAFLAGRRRIGQPA
jgi:diguanylate cyclase (GGDEF)-like protein